MKKRIILITILLACIPIILVGYEVYEYFDYLKISDENNNKIKEEIEQIDTDIENKKNSIEELKINNSEKLKLLELWKKRLEKIK